MLQAIFYARFHPLRGPSIIHQYPPTSILPPPSSTDKPLINWSNLSSYIIPPYALCNQPLSILAEDVRVLGFPVSLEDPEYDRNRFTFNICFVVSAAENPAIWEGLVRKTARFFEVIEREDCVLQIEEDLRGLKLAGEEGYPEKGVGTVAYLLERVWEDLNAFGECCVQLIGYGTGTLNLRVEEPEEEEGQKVRVRSWDVPVLIRGLPSREEWTRDLTLERVGEWVDGVRHVGRIAEVADVEVKLVKRCVRELVMLKRAIVLDIFHFGAIYTCTKDVVEFVRDEELQEECRAYVAVPLSPSTDNDDDNDKGSELPSRETLINLYTSLQPGLQLRDFCLEHATSLTKIDTRRLITFGLIKGFLRRIHKFALASDSHASPLPSGGKKRSSGSNRPPSSNEDESAAAAREMDRAWRKAALSSGWATPPQNVGRLTPRSGGGGGSGSFVGSSRRNENEIMRERVMYYLDGAWPLDRACVEMGLGEKGFLEKVRSGRCGEVVLFNK